MAQRRSKSSLVCVFIFLPNLQLRLRLEKKTKYADKQTVYVIMTTLFLTLYGLTVMPDRFGPPMQVYRVCSPLPDATIMLINAITTQESNETTGHWGGLASKVDFATLRRVPVLDIAATVCRLFRSRPSGCTLHCCSCFMGRLY